MTQFTSFEAVAAAVPIANIDTDMLVPARFLKTVSREGLSDALFCNLRSADPDFPLNRPPWNSAGILIALDNFGCGSSREHAPWALLDFGIRCVIAPSFADIFHQNCFKNGILPIQLPPNRMAPLMERAADPRTALMKVSLEEQRIICGRLVVPFQIDTQSRERLLNGFDEISLSLEYSGEIAAYERSKTKTQPWLRPISFNDLE